MTDTGRNFLVGLFVIASATVLAVLMVWFGEAPEWLGGSEWTLRIVDVTELSGVAEGSPVKLNGVDIGRVKSLAFEDNTRPGQGVVILCGIKREFTVPRGALARVYGATLGIGTGHIEIIVAKGLKAQPLDPESAVIKGEMRSVIGEMISKELVNSVERSITNIGELAGAAVPVSVNLAELLEPRSVEEVNEPGAASRGFTPNISTLVERIDTLGANLNAVLGDKNVQGDLKATVRDLRDVAASLNVTVSLWQTESKRLADNLNRRVDESAGNLHASFARLDGVLGNLDDATSTLVRVLHRIDDGEGTAGLLARDARLYESGVLALERVAELAATLQRIVGQAERDGFIKVGKATPVGIITVDIPTGEVVATLIEKIPTPRAATGPPIPGTSD